ncbi:MAG TPA: M48 family metalloprotease [Candidatus Angelobacter sp.]|nr:M48 family metalloprotease [Candidatus Angelobacter sp.]
MMFYLLAAALCLAVFFLVMGATLVVCNAGLRMARPLVASWAPRNAANLLFSVQVLPFGLGSVAALGIALPAFLKFEPRATSELLNAKLIFLATGGAVVITAMAARAIWAWRATARAVAQWRTLSTDLHIPGVGRPVHRVEQDSPLMAVAGLLRPRIFVGRSIVQVLGPDELAAALAHEEAHARSFDNFKQLWFRIVRLPEWLEQLAPGKAAWDSLSEMAADEDALAEGASPLDLSSALIKVARLEHCPLHGDLVACQFMPDGGASALELRAARLEQWLASGASPRTPKIRDWRWMTVLAVSGAALLYVTFLGSLLPWMHEALEALVR